MPEIITKGANPFLILLALSQKSSISLTDVDGLNDLPEQLEAYIDAVASAEVTLEDLADEIDFGEFDHYGDTNAMRKQAETLRRLRLDLKDFLADVYLEKVKNNSEKEACHE